MHRLLISLAISLLAVEVAAASVETELTSVVQQWADGFNKANAELIAASCADEASVVDDFPPHEWKGAGACTRWFTDFQAFATRVNIADAVITVGEPGHVDITGDVAYVVTPMKLAYRSKGKPASLDGIVTIILRNGAAGWRITSVTWADV